MTASALCDRFWSKVDKRGPDECWPWKAHADQNGYGRIYGHSRVLRAHRVSWEMHNGPIPEGGGYHGTCVLHRCDNPRCVNPAHLFLGTNADNAADRNSKGRSKGGCLRGEANPQAKLTEAQIADIRASEDVQHVIAARFGISQQHVSNVRRGGRWA